MPTYICGSWLLAQSRSLTAPADVYGGRCLADNCGRDLAQYEAMVSIIRSVMSLGCDVVKRMRISGAALAVISNSEAKSTIVPSGCSCL